MSAEQAADTARTEQYQVIDPDFPDAFAEHPIANIWKKILLYLFDIEFYGPRRYMSCNTSSWQN